MTSTLPTATETAQATSHAQRNLTSTGRLAVPPVVRLRSSPSHLTLGLLLGVIVMVQGWNIQHYPALGDDEGTYLAQAWAVQQGKGLAHYTYWYDHPPLGWIQIAFLTWIPSLVNPESMTVASIRLSMLLPTAVSCVLLHVLARRLRLPRWAAGLAVLLFGLSPLAVALQRGIFLDNLAVMWILLAFCLAASPSRHLWHHFGAGVSAAVSVLTKETMLVVLPALLVTMWRFSHRDTRKFAVTGAITACTLTGLSYPLFALLRGELLPGAGHVSLWDGIAYQLTRSGSGSVFAGGTKAHHYLHSWLGYDTVLLFGGLAGAALLLVTLRWSVTARTFAGPALAVAILALVGIRPSGYLPAMYVIQALPFLALVLAACTASVTHAILRKGRRPAEGRPLTITRWTITLLLAASAALYVVPRWYGGARTAMTDDANGPYLAATQWLRDEVADRARTRVLVDDALWLDLVHAGYKPGPGAVWFYKADIDPAIKKTMPHGWRDIDYAVVSPLIQSEGRKFPTVNAVLKNSTPVAVFDNGDYRIEIRRTDK
ncbi:phospholipid carrier-dependent glycosyltransferase [Streptomyces sp. TRM72054]|uniref:ArnT family glycosyltransferase n=1 Tax=Streptomyces sp. TRM72054 TaxID=2870562 RepID=UPI0027E1365F|nr:phospholipid carrier-dependent glycosyltransferase [Streptomyces sp. TRM72054]